MDLELDYAAVGPPDPALEDGRPAGFELGSQERDFGEVVRLEVAGPERAYQLVATPAQELRHRRVDVHDLGFVTQHEDSVGDLLDQVPIAFLTGPQALLGLPSFGEVDHGDDGVGLAHEIDDVGREEAAGAVSVGAPDRQFEVSDVACHPQLFGHPIPVAGIVEQAQLHGRFADCLLSGQPGRLDEGPVDVDDAALVAEARDEHRHARGAECGREPGFAGPQRVFDRPLFADVLDRRHQAGVAVHFEDRARQQSPGGDAVGARVADELSPERTGCVEDPDALGQVIRVEEQTRFLCRLAQDVFASPAERFAGSGVRLDQPPGSQVRDGYGHRRQLEGSLERGAPGHGPIRGPGDRRRLSVVPAGPRW